MYLYRDDPGQKINLKAFLCEIVNDHQALKQEQDNYLEIPPIRRLVYTIVHRNYLQIKQDVQEIIHSEMEQVLSNSSLKHLVVSK